MVSFIWESPCLLSLVFSFCYYSMRSKPSLHFIDSFSESCLELKSAWFSHFRADCLTDCDALD